MTLAFISLDLEQVYRFIQQTRVKIEYSSYVMFLRFTILIVLSFIIKKLTWINIEMVIRDIGRVCNFGGGGSMFRRAFFIAIDARLLM